MSNQQPENRAPTRTQYSQSKRFCATDSDITLQSSDGVLFKVHKKNLEMHSEGFAGADAIAKQSASDNEVVPLTESSAVLELLLQYMYRQPQPDLKNVDFETLAGVAEAAEKYQVFTAISWCKMLMENAIPKHPLAVLSYATRHGYSDILDEAAEETIGVDAYEVTAKLSPAYLLAWYRYHQSWLNALQRAYPASERSISSHYGRKAWWKCDNWTIISATIMQRLGANPGSLKKLNFVFADIRGMESCPSCSRDFKEWETRATRERNGLPLFSYFL